LPPLKTGPYDQGGTFIFAALNVYFNAPVDSEIISAPAVGSAATMRAFIDHQRDEQYGSLEQFDWPILLSETAVRPDGSLQVILPADVPLFEQLRSAKPAYTIPMTGQASAGNLPGAAHVSGMNYARPGTVVRCVGCHAGHTLIPVPKNAADALFTNLSPGASIEVSSKHPSLTSFDALIDRRVQKPIPGLVPWRSASGAVGQWVQLTFPVPVTVRTVRLYNLPASDLVSLQVRQSSVRLYADAGATQELARKNSGLVSSAGTDVAFSDIRARSIRVYFAEVSGTYEFEGSVASLAEIEVIARAEVGP
jgi:hypothetical protein